MNDNNLILVSNSVQPAVIDYNYEAVKKMRRTEGTAVFRDHRYRR